MSAPDQISFIPRHGKESPLYNNPELARTANQYRTSEEIPPDTLTEFYTTASTIGPRSFSQGWMELELGMHDPSRLPDAFINLRKTRQNQTNKDEDIYSDASLALAFMPVFADRALGRTPDDETLRTTRSNLLTLLTDSIVPYGHKGLVATIMLGIDRSIETGDRRHLIYPSSPREGRSVFRNPFGHRANHDCYTLNGTKRPIEVKLFNGSHPYARDILCFMVGIEVHRAIKENRLYSNRPLLRRGGIANNERIVQCFINALRGVGHPASNRRLIESIHNTLWGSLAEHNKQYPHPGTVRSLTGRDAIPVGQPPRILETVSEAAGASVMSLVGGIIKVRELAIQPELFTAEERIIDAAGHLSSATAGESGPLGDALKELGDARTSLRAALHGLMVFFEASSTYTNKITK